ncbi:MAG: SDR family oxidoreductase [Tunicatimonas sp.]
MQKKPFHGKVIIITGSGSGIGKATARMAGQQGGRVVLNGRNAEKLERAEQSLRALGVTVLAVVADVATVAGAQYLVDATLQHYGKIDILINNAGMSSRGYFASLAPAVMEDMLRINVLGSLYPTRAALAALKETHGSVVFVSSVAGIRGLPETSLYCASKMALTSVAESLRVELWEDRIHVGIVYVGITQNDHGKQVIDADGTRIPLRQRDQGRAQTPQAVAKSVLRLIRRRRFKTTLTILGKVNRWANVLFPRVVDIFLVRSKDRIARMNR